MAIKFSESIKIYASPQTVFDYTQDYSNRLKWDSFLKKASLIDGAIAAEKGVRAYCVARNGLGMVTEYVTFSRPKVTAIKITKGPYLFKQFSGSWTFNQETSNVTNVIFIYFFSLCFPFNLFGSFIKICMVM